MTKNRRTLHIGLNVLFIVISMLMLADFLLPGRVMEGKIASIEVEQQEYYNAARNHHFSYRLFTDTRDFSITEDFAKKARSRSQIEYRVSRIFNEINHYSLINSEAREIYSLRILSGLILPLLVISAMAVAFKYPNKVNVLVMVLQAVLIGNLIYLCL